MLGTELRYSFVQTTREAQTFVRLTHVGLGYEWLRIHRVPLPDPFDDLDVLDSVRSKTSHFVRD